MQGITLSLNPEIEREMRTFFKGLQNLGVIHIGHGIIRKGRVSTAIYSHQEWGEKYIEEEYYRVDPLRLYALYTTFKVLSWDALVVEDKKEKEALYQRKKICSVKNGLLITLRSPDIIETFALGTDSARLCMTSLISNPSIKRYLKKISETHNRNY